MRWDLGGPLYQELPSAVAQGQEGTPPRLGERGSKPHSQPRGRRPELIFLRLYTDTSGRRNEYPHPIVRIRGGRLHPRQSRRRGMIEIGRSVEPGQPSLQRSACSLQAGVPQPRRWVDGASSLEIIGREDPGP